MLNAHKWLGAAFDCSLYYVRDPEHLVRVMSTNPSYLQSAADERVKNLRDWGIPLGRRFRALKLWCLIRAEGVAGCRPASAGTSRMPAGSPIRCGRRPTGGCWRRCPCRPFASGTSRRASRERTLDRHTPAGPSGSTDRASAYLTPAMLDGRWMVRVSIGAEPTERAHVEALWRLIRHEAERQ